jgi:hypothetical protein
LASLQPDQAAFVLTALANDPARLHQPAPGLAAAGATHDGSSLEDLPGADMSGVAGAIMVFEQVIRVRHQRSKGTSTAYLHVSASRLSLVDNASNVTSQILVAPTQHCRCQSKLNAKHVAKALHEQLDEVLFWVLQELELHLAQPTIMDWAVLTVGYVVIGGLALAGLWVFLAWKVVRSGRRGRGIAWARNALGLAGRQFRAYLIRVGFGAKVGLPAPLPLSRSYLSIFTGSLDPY